MYEEIFDRLQKSDFRCKFKLGTAEKAYISQKGIAAIEQHCHDFIAKRIAPAVIPNDGRQTPMRGHPVFIAQHATACCCRGCINKWHHLPQHTTLSEEEQNFLCGLILAWINRQLAETAPAAPAPNSAKIL